jgi:hypothetical protein
MRSGLLKPKTTVVLAATQNDLQTTRSICRINVVFVLCECDSSARSATLSCKHLGLRRRQELHSIAPLTLLTSLTTTHEAWPVRANFDKQMFSVKPKYVLSIVVLVIATALTTVYWIVTTNRLQQEHAAAVVTMFGGDESLAIVAHPEKVEAYRLGLLPEGVDTGKATLADHPITGGPVEVPPAVGADLARVLKSGESYGWDYDKLCGAPVFGVAVSFHRAADRIDVLFCFKCNVLLVERNGSITGGEDFDPIRPILVRSIKLLFPADAVIQSLGESPGG